MRVKALEKGQKLSRELVDLDIYAQPVRPKRTASAEGREVSPPSKKARTKVGATTNKDAIKSFFTPASQKGPPRLTWRTIHDSLLVGQFRPDQQTSEQSTDRQYTKKRRRIAAFDFDSTLITTSSGTVFGKSPSDWKWWNAVVPSKLHDLYDQGYQLAIISNQAGLSLSGKEKTSSKVKRLADFKIKCNAVLNALNIPITLYAATARDVYRKPRPGMWQELLDDCDLDVKDENGHSGAELDESFFVGDAAGRIARANTKADHSSGDRDFAENVGINFYTPEEFFLNDCQEVEWKRSFDPHDYIDEMIQPQAAIPDGTGEERSGTGASPPFTKKHPLEIAMLVGSPGSGKSTFYHKHLEPLGYARANQDTLKTRDKCIRFAKESIVADKTSVAVDNTNADRKTREEWVKLARELRVPIRCIWLQAPPEVCRHNEVIRYMNSGTAWNPENRDSLPAAAFGGYSSRFQRPEKEEGFDELVEIPFRFEGTDEMRKAWSSFWI